MVTHVNSHHARFFSCPFAVFLPLLHNLPFGFSVHACSITQVMRGMPDLVLQRAEANAPRRDITPVADVAGGGGKVGIGKEGCVQPVWGGAAASSGDSGGACCCEKLDCMINV